MSNPTLEDIILESIPTWLEESGYDGLCDPDDECGCYCEHGLFDCGLDTALIIMRCRAGYKHVKPDGDSEIRLEKPKKERKP
jgi:hypothetical protein